MNPLYSLWRVDFGKEGTSAVLPAYLNGSLMSMPLLLHHCHKAAVRAVGSCQPWGTCATRPLPPAGGGHLSLQHCLRGAVVLQCMCDVCQASLRIGAMSNGCQCATRITLARLTASVSECHQQHCLRETVLLQRMCDVCQTSQHIGLMCIIGLY